MNNMISCNTPIGQFVKLCCMIYINKYYKNYAIEYYL